MPVDRDGMMSCPSSGKFLAVVPPALDAYVDTIVHKMSSRTGMLAMKSGKYSQPYDGRQPICDVEQLMRNCALHCVRAQWRMDKARYSRPALPDQALTEHTGAFG